MLLIPLRPANNTITGIVSSLAQAHNAYCQQTISTATALGILMIVQPNNVNTCDERPIEYALASEGVPCYRLIWNAEALSQLSLSPSKALLYGGAEISVVYHRAGYDIEEYDIAGRELRYRIEISRAIKCPSILAHLATLKVVQQQLTKPEHLRRFLSPEEVEQVQACFVKIYPLDDTDAGKEGQRLALDENIAMRHVLKPSLEGGGHNIFRDDIPRYLECEAEITWKEYVLMELIETPSIENVLVARNDVYKGPVVSELGVFGACLWRTEGGVEVLSNEQIGVSFKTKSAEVDEISVVKGYGCFDSPFLI